MSMPGDRVTAVVIGRRTSMTDELFEYLVLLKKNRLLWVYVIMTEEG